MILKTDRNQRTKEGRTAAQICEALTLVFSTLLFMNKRKKVASNCKRLGKINTHIMSKAALSFLLGFTLSVPTKYTYIPFPASPLSSLLSHFSLSSFLKIPLYILLCYSAFDKDKDNDNFKWTHIGVNSTGISQPRYTYKL